MRAGRTDQPIKPVELIETDIRQSPAPPAFVLRE
jgi:hypothetical protein